MSTPDPTETYEVSPEELKSLLDADAVRLIDCREEDEYFLCRIEGATLVPLQQIPSRIGEVEGAGGKPIVVF